MIKAAILVASMTLGGNGFAYESDNEELEICVTSGQCALRVHEESGRTVYLARKADLETLRLLWTGASFFPVSEKDYSEVRGWLPVETLILPATNPDEERAGGRPAPQPKPSPSGPLVSAPITITVGGTGCSECHTGSMRDIHKKSFGEDTK